MTDHQFYVIWGEALTSDHRNIFVSDWALSSMWGDAPDAEIPAERVAELGKIWDVAHMSIRDLVGTVGITQAKFAERYCIPKRTVENWCTGINTPPDYVRLALARLAGLLD